MSDKEVRRNLAKARHYFAKDCEKNYGDECQADGEECPVSCRAKKMTFKELQKLDDCDLGEHCD